MSLFIAALGTLVIHFVPQSLEGLAGLCDDQELSALVAFTLSALWWAASSWYLARSMLRFAFSDQVPAVRNHRVYRGTARWLPRVLGIVPLAGIAVAMWRSPAQPGMALIPGLAMTALAIIFGTFLFYRTHLLRWLEKRLGPNSRPLVKSSWQDLDEMYDPSLTELLGLPQITRWLLTAHVGISVLLFAAYAVNPVWLGQKLGAPTVLMISLATWIACGSIITYGSSRLRAPLFLFLLLLAVAASGCVDNHVATARATYPPGRRTLASDFEEWRRLNAVPVAAPYIVIATEGGGIRAAYWTAAILTRIQDRYPAFSSRLYAISGVSGGSLGAATFDVLLTRPAQGRYHERAQAALGRDFLAAPLGRLLYTDLVQRLLPWGFTTLDRGVALEQAWTKALEHQGIESFGQPFEDFWVQNPALPRLFLNATWVERGNRVVFSAPKLEPADETTDGTPLASFTFVQAVHASARFPYISPALTIPGREHPWGHLVDGGYFENSGAITARDVIAATGAPAPARAIIIRYCDDANERHPLPARWATELTAPPIAFFATREARGTLAVKSLQTAFGPDRVADLCLRPRAGKPVLPLGWMLSKSAQAEINDQANDAMQGDEIGKVRAWLELPAP